MIAEKIDFDGREAYDIGWGVIVWPWKRKKGGTAELYVKPDLALADEYGACYIATETGRCQGIYYVMRSDECRRFVMDKRTQGIGQRGTHWSYYWTTIKHLVERGGAREGPLHA